MGPRDHNRAWGAQQAPGILMELGDQNESLGTTRGPENYNGPGNTMGPKEHKRDPGPNKNFGGQYGDKGP